MGPKYYFSVLTGQKHCQSDKNIYEFVQLEYIRTIDMKYYQIGILFHSNSATVS